jgi:hypothetical protein
MNSGARMEQVKGAIDAPLHLEFPESSTEMQTSDGQFLDSVTG